MNILQRKFNQKYFLFSETETDKLTNWNQIYRELDACIPAQIPEAIEKRPNKNLMLLSGRPLITF